jgi:hypothetical protein
MSPHLISCLWRGEQFRLDSYDRATALSGDSRNAITGLSSATVASRAEVAPGDARIERLSSLLMINA